MPDLPSSLALTQIADDANVIASDHRNNYAAIQAAVNALKDALAGGTAKQFLQATDSDTVGWAGDYTAFTPTWTASGTAPSLGNGILSGRYIQIGKLVHYTMYFQAGTTTTFGTSVWNFTLPVTGNALIPASTPIGVTYALDSSASAVSFAPLIFATTTKVNIQAPITWPTGTQNIYTNLVPWTWANLDTLWATGTYEAA